MVGGGALAACRIRTTAQPIVLMEDVNKGGALPRGLADGLILCLKPCGKRDIYTH